MLHVTLIFILVAAYGLHQIEGCTDPELTIHHDGVNMKLICSASPGVASYTWKLNSNTIWQTNCTDTHSEVMSSHCYPNGTGTLIIKDEWTQNPFGTWMCIVYNPNVIYQAERNIRVSTRVAPFIKPENIIRVRQGETAVLRIDVLSKPPPVFSWSKLTDTDEWTPVRRFKNVTVVSESLQSILTIPGIGPKDAGRYKVVASNEYGRPFVQEYEVILEGDTAHGSSNNTVILINGIAGACLVLIAAGVGIKCYRSKHRPRPVTQSLNMADRRSAELHYYSTVDESEPETSRDNGNNDGTSSPVEREDVNKKANHAANPNRINVNVDLSAKVSPRADPLIKLENIIRVHVSETAVLRIDVLSKPPPVFSWYKLTDTDEWTPVELFKHIVVLNERLHSNLIIAGAGPHNEGTYRAVASNGYGIPFIQEYEVILEDGAPAAEEGTHVHERANQAAKQIPAYANVNQSVPDGASSTEVGALEYEQTTRVNKAEHVYTPLQGTGENGRSSSVKGSNVNKIANPAAANKSRTHANVNRSVPGGASSTGDGANIYEQTARGDMDEHVYTDIC